MSHSLAAVGFGAKPTFVEPTAEGGLGFASCNNLGPPGGGHHYRDRTQARRAAGRLACASPGPRQTRCGPKTAAREAHQHLLRDKGSSLAAQGSLVAGA